VEVLTRSFYPPYVPPVKADGVAQNAKQVKDVPAQKPVHGRCRISYTMRGMTARLGEDLTSAQYKELLAYADEEAKVVARAHVKQQREEEVNRFHCPWYPWVDVPDEWVQRNCGWYGRLRRSRWYEMYCDKLRQARLCIMHDVLRFGVQSQLVKMMKVTQK
jgi:hypothetical protein